MQAQLRDQCHPTTGKLTSDKNMREVLQWSPVHPQIRGSHRCSQGPHLASLHLILHPFLHLQGS